MCGSLPKSYGGNNIVRNTIIPKIANYKWVILNGIIRIQIKIKTKLLNLMTRKWYLSCSRMVYIDISMLA